MNIDERIEALTMNLELGMKEIEGLRKPRKSTTRVLLRMRRTSEG